MSILPAYAFDGDTPDLDSLPPLVSQVLQSVCRPCSLPVWFIRQILDFFDRRRANLSWIPRSCNSGHTVPSTVFVRFEWQQGVLVKFEWQQGDWVLGSGWHQ